MKVMFCSVQYKRILHKLSKLKETVGVISSDPPILEWRVICTKVPLEPLTDQGLFGRYTHGTLCPR